MKSDYFIDNKDRGIGKPKFLININMNNKLVGWGLAISITLAFSTGMFDLSEDFLTLSGLGIMVFGIWACVILFKTAK